MLALTQPEGVVFDPYCGVGSTIIDALQHDRKAIAAELDSNYITIRRERIQKFADGELPLRPLGKSIHKPTGKNVWRSCLWNGIGNRNYCYRINVGDHIGYNYSIDNKQLLLELDNKTL